MKLRTLILGLTTTSAATIIAAAALADPPERAGRVAFVEGDVSFQPPEADFWTQATRNYPVAPGESFWTGDNGRAELRIGFAEARLDNETELDVVETGYGALRLAMPQGSASIRLRRDPSAPVSISTPAGDVHLDTAGLYRIDVGAQEDDGSYPPVQVTVFNGEADAPSAEGPAFIDPGEAALVWAGFDPEMQDAQDAAIDDWARDREAREQWRPRPEISENMTGFEDLDGAGDFVANPQYGTVWFPRDVSADWAPYRFGHWAYVAPWGYTWIDDQPWGFAPFHYGRWAQVEGRWGWIPGRPEPRPVYAPALVAFVGGGGWSVNLNIGGVGIGVGGGGGVQAMGWVPLAPDEVYRPPYQVSAAYVRNVNVTNVRTVTINRVVNETTINNVTINNYKNVSAATVVRADAMTRGAPVQQAAVHVAPETLAKAPAVTSHAALPPPTPAARAGVAPAKTGSGEPAAVRTAAPPPAKLAAVRTAVVTQAPGSTKPPVIAGARIAAAKPKAAGALIAPAQVHNPAAQGKQAVTPAAHPVAAKLRTAPAMPKTAAKAAAPAVEARPMAKPAAATAEAKPAVAPKPKPAVKAAPVASKAPATPVSKPKPKSDVRPAPVLAKATPVSKPKPKPAPVGAASSQAKAATPSEKAKAAKDAKAHKAVDKAADTPAP